MDNNQLLPYELIDAKLFDTMLNQLAEEDKHHHGEVPKFWQVLAEESNKSALFPVLIDNVIMQFQERGQDALGGVILKLLLMGWKMADCYLSQHIEKTGAQ